MAQSNNVQREPSMEEILASIRRIIEDSDTSRKPGEDTPDAVNDAPAVDNNNIHAFRLGLHEEPGRSEPRPMEAEDFPPLQPRRAEVLRPEAAQANSVPAGDFPQFFARPAATAGDEPAQRPDEIEMELSLDDFSAPTDIDADETAQLGASGEPRSSIMSDRAGRQVAASFGELSAAFEARSRKSFDEIAEEMMRPMLQDWLDNNLPHLVERLVREEIERIARGAATTR